jgi:ferredoxin-NADP reductase
VRAFLEAELPDWNSEDDNKLVCRRVVQETHDVRTFTFSAPTPHKFVFKPGQFLTFEFEIASKTVYRCYTIASAPTRPYSISITSKRVPGGSVSNWLHDHLRPGMTVRATGPMGDFSAYHHPAAKYLFLSGGSGITPLMSMARTYHDLGEDADIVFIHSARSPADIIFGAELDRLAITLPRFRLTVTCEADAPLCGWSGYCGRLSLPMLKLIAPDFAKREIFTCGPAPYMSAVRGLLAEGGADAFRYHQESFDFAELDKLADEQPAIVAVSGFRVEFAKSNRIVVCPPEQTILQAAKEAGLKLPSACTRGMCGTCKSRMISGRVDMKHEGGIRQREIDQGLILLCCSKPQADTVIDR